jgi:hypothetical protein
MVTGFKKFLSAKDTKPAHKINFNNQISHIILTKYKRSHEKKIKDFHKLMCSDLKLKLFKILCDLSV